MRAAPTRRAVVDRARRSSGARRRAGLRHQHRIRRAGGTAIPRDALGALQLNLLRSHAAGVGDPLAGARGPRVDGAARQRARQGLLGHPARDARALIAMLNAGVHPRVPSRGSVGASGDLAPLAHIWRSSSSARATPGSATIDDPRRRRPLAPEACATGLTLAPQGRAGAHQRHAAIDAVLALALPAPNGWRARPTSRPRCRSTRCAGRCTRSIPRIHEARPHPGRSPRPEHLAPCSKAAPSTSPTRTAAASRTPIRCAAPPRCTARREALAFARTRPSIEANAATDNPMVFADGDIISGGNFHGAPVALAADTRDRRWRSSPRSASGGSIGWSTRR